MLNFCIKSKTQLAKVSLAFGLRENHFKFKMFLRIGLVFLVVFATGFVSCQDKIEDVAFIKLGSFGECFCGLN
jgi:predicted permease